MIRKFVTNMFKWNLKSKNEMMALGRWNTHDNQAVKSILANSDNCGDLICKDPKEVSQFIKDEIKNPINKKKIN